MKHEKRFGLMGWLLLTAVVAMGSSIGGNFLRIGTLTGTDIEIQMGEGRVKWDSGTSKLRFANDISTFKDIASADQLGNNPGLTENAGIDTSVGASALTVKLVQADGSTDATASDSIRASFRSSTLTNGGYNIRLVTAALSAVVPSTATLGHTSAVDEDIFVYLLDNAGTPEIALSSSQEFPESDLHSTTILDASSDAANVLYSTVARSDVPIRLIGRLVSNQATAGTWASAPTTESILSTKVKARTVTTSRPAGLDTHVCYISGGGTPVLNIGCSDWVDSVTDAGVGKPQLNVTSGIFSVFPVCHVTVQSATKDRSASLVTTSTSIVDALIIVASTGAAADENLFVTCYGLK